MESRTTPPSDMQMEAKRCFDFFSQLSLFIVLPGFIFALERKRAKDKVKLMEKKINLKTAGRYFEYNYFPENVS